MIIGDSLSWEHYRSLNHLLGMHVSQFSQHQSKAEQGNIVHYGCRQQTRLVYRRDDLLSNVTEAVFGQGTFPQVLVMNRGAHFQNDTTLLAGMNKVIAEINAWRALCFQFNMTCHLFWRTSVPGHPHCDKNNSNIFDGPVNDLVAMETMIANLSNYDNRTIRYHWYDYQHQNELVLDLLTKTLGEPGIVNGYDHFTFDVLDAYYLNVLRPDEHRAHQGDCLHNCYPGKMDVYSQLLQHFLTIHRSQRDIDSLIEWQNGRQNNKTNSSR
jgi:hypothetical protein